ncbi:MAG: flagellar basal-body MS-ring/collar protein FliF [Terracidiphilus sp.]|nr:flagellar basal-body MS-ring/collar protein FliF [Terracidiphilus sp.]
MATGTQLEKSAPAKPGQPQLADQIAGLWGRARVRWGEMAPSQRGWAVGAALLLVALSGGLLWYALRPDWRTLYMNLEPEDARQIGQILATAQITYEPTADGSGIRVPAAQLDKARLATAAKGGVKSGRLGFEIFDKPNWVGSEFDEQVNYQRALEGELEHTVGTLADIESARVHLVLPHDSLFRDQERAAKASVVIKLRHRSLADGEPDAIRNLISAAVDGLTPGNVVLVDASGHLPLGPKTAEAMQLTAEQALEEKLVSTLEPVTGTGNVRASVTLDYDRAASDVTQQIYDPDKTVTLSMQRTEQTTGAQAVAAGVPGAASNAPNTQALPVYPQQMNPPQTAKTESGTYGASKTDRHVVEGPGRVRRLTAAIVVNDRLAQAAGGGKAAVWQPRSADEVRNLTTLAQAAVGFDPARGDMLTVEDLAFDQNRALPPVPVIERLANRAENSPVLVKYAALLVGLLVVLIFGVRPALRRAGPQQAAAKKAAKGGAKELPVAASTATPAPALKPPPEPVEMDPERLRNQEIFEQVTDHLKREPTQSSRLLQSWIHSD